VEPEPPESRRRVAVVVGDVTMDWNLATIDRSRGGAADTTQAHWQAGGTALLGALLEAVAAPLRFTVLHVGHVVEERDNRFRHSYAVWSRFPYARGANEPHVWRVEKFLGLDRRDPAEGAAAVAEWKRVHDDLAEADLVVLDDAALGFRDDDGLWPKALEATQAGAPWVLLKMARPVADGKLWEHLLRTGPGRVIAVITIDDLRLSEVRISRELSWERTAEDLAWELTHNPRVNALSHCAHVVVSLDSGGALLVSSSRTEEAAGVERPPRCVLFYDPLVIEGTWADEHPGGVVGYTSCLAAGIAREIMLAQDDPDVARGIQHGLAAMRELHRRGYGTDDHGAPARLAFPLEEIASVLAADGAPFEQVEVPPAPVGALLQPGAQAEPGTAHPWTILRDACEGRLGGVAREIALKGVRAAVGGVPLGQFGKLVTVDRAEIEGLRAISALVREYSRQHETRPLSIAVFGPPGAGKSFAVEQVATSVLPDEVEELKFNLSQFNGPAELNGALHQVRDKALDGKLPLVFWDEFDTTLHGREGSERLGWLRHFLVPMQDGTFQEGQITHPIGRAVFVFAGGVYGSMREFQTQEPGEFKEVKGPDFVSRLKGYVDVVGPNPRGNDPDEDPYFIVRRAILLRSILERNRPGLFRDEDGHRRLRIDSGVLRAFLETREYRHGVRSLESIVAMSSLSGKGHFERSCLPADPQLDLHVDKDDFLALVQRLDAEGELLERLAEGVHVVFCEKLLDAEFVWGEPTNDYLLRHGLLRRFADEMDERRAADRAKTNPALVPYEKLPSNLQEQNRNHARDIPNKLVLAGYIMRPARSENVEVVFAGGELDTLELLAEQEHERWLWEKLHAGWRWGPERDQERKENPALVPWERLTDEEQRARYGAFAELVGDGPLPDDVREWDRALVAGIPKVLAVAGYTVMKHTPDGRSST
jgi:hypothetical protein